VTTNYIPEIRPTIEAGKAADQKYCHSCGAILHFSAASCPKCGAAQPASNWLPPALQPAGSPTRVQGGLPPGHVYCRGCGEGIHETALSCPKCGATQRTTSASYAQSGGANRTTAGILGIVLGGLGVHKFYLGQIFMGLIYLIFCWTFIPAFIGLIEGIYYLTMTDSEFARKY
jgi:RNA polymerase subunit RPABC4/transcription elongation factor Spt4